MRAIIGGCLMLLTTPPVHAQTALETFGYIMGGDQAAIDEKTGTATYQEAVGATEPKLDLRSFIKKSGDCLYVHTLKRYDVEGKQDSEVVRRYDLRELGDVEYLNNHVQGQVAVLRGSRRISCPAAADAPETDCSSGIWVRVKGTKERWQKAYDHLRSTYCKGRAF